MNSTAVFDLDWCAGHHYWQTWTRGGFMFPVQTSRLYGYIEHDQCMTHMGVWILSIYHIMQSTGTHGNESAHFVCCVNGNNDKGWVRTTSIDTNRDICLFMIVVIGLMGYLKKMTHFSKEERWKMSKGFFYSWVCDTKISKLYSHHHWVT